MLRLSSSPSVSVALVLVIGAVLFATAADASTVTPTMGYQSWACRTPLLPQGASTATPQAPTPLGANATAPEQPSSAASAIKFLYNVAYGPPNYYIISSGGTAAQQASLIDAVFLSRQIPSFAANTVEWTATIGSTAANGFPYGCCGGIGAVTVQELGCKNCISPSNSALPVIQPTNWQALQTGPNNQVVTCNGQPGYQLCTQTTYVPGALSGIAATYPITDPIVTGTGVTTLAFPSQSNAVLAAGVYTFQLWAESICGVVPSANVQLAARCPPSPTIAAVLRQTPTSPGGATNLLQANADGSYTVVVGSTALVDASCSYAYQINKPNWPLTQSTTNAPLGFNPTRNLYAIQKVYFSVANPSMTSITTTSVTSNSATFNAVPIWDQWATTATFSVAGTHWIVITATDGCSAGQAMIKVVAVCTCQPVAKAMYVPTIWSNQGTTGAVGTTLNNFANQAATLSTAQTNPLNTDMLGVPTPLFTYTLTGSAYDYEAGLAANSANLAYDWNFVYWVPDYSVSFSKASQQPPQSLAQAYLMGQAPSTTVWPPSTGAACSPSGGVPLPCAQGWFGLTPDPTGAARCCFSAANDMIWDVAGVTRPSKGQYVYKVLQVMTSPIVPLRQFTSGVRTKVYNFMRISSGCNSAAPAGFDWMSNITSVALASNAATYFALPTYLQFAQNGQAAGSLAPYQDFDGFPNVNSATPSNQAGPFRPTTECGAWLKQQSTPWNFQDVQTKVNSTVQCGRNTDLVLCRVTITQNGGFNTQTATLSVSSFGSCRGLWQFSLTVDDSCLNSTDYFAVNVGCNRAPSVSAGCTNTQTWSALSGSAQFDQISLDGRASYDPDNFVDSFYSLAAVNGADSYPGCITTVAGTPPTTQNTCVNGGLGTYGLTYAWALLSYYNPLGQLAYPIVNSTGAITGCPTSAANIAAACVDSYCSGATSWLYPTVNAYTRMYDGSSLTGTVNVFRTSPQGGTVLVDAWQMGFYAVNPVAQAQIPAIPSTSPTYNRMPVIDTSGSTMTSQMIFPDFNANCAPTVYPMFLPALTGTPSMFGTQTSNSDWAYAQQLKHVGSTAYMVGLTNAGTYTARLYAFDGCSVGWADVSFTLECPVMTFADPTSINWGLYSTYTAGNTSVTYTPPNFVITYGGTQEIPLAGTVTVYPSVNGAIVNTPVRSCSFVQQGTAQAKNVPPSSRTMDVSNTNTGCQNLIWTSGQAATWLAPGSYLMVATVSDGCNRGSVVSVTSPSFTIACQSVQITSFSTVNTATINRQLTYTLPTGNSPPSGQFPSFTFNITAQSPTAQAGIFNDVAVSWAVYWRPGQSAVINANAADGGAAQAFSSFFPNNVPATNVYNIYIGSSGVVPSGNLATPPSVPGGARPIQFQNTGAVSLSARVSTDTVTGLLYNTATGIGQANFFPAAKSASAIYWLGDYYVRVTGTASINGALSQCSTTTTNTADQLFTVGCPAAMDPSVFVTVSNQEWTNSGVSIFSSLYFNNVPFDSSVQYCGGNSGSLVTSGTANGDSYCTPGGGTGSGGFRSFNLVMNATAFNVYPGSSGSSVSYRISYRAPFALAPNATNTAVPNAAAVNFLMFFQNPLLLSPFAYMGLSNPAAFVTKAWAANAATQTVQVDIPGTWTIDTFNTNGCNNVTGRSIDFSAYCYDPSMPEANLVYKVLARPPPASCAAAQLGTDAAGNQQCDVTSTAVTACSPTIVRGPLAKPTGSFGRRRLIGDDEEQVMRTADDSSRKLLQSASTVCSLNANFMQPTALGNLNFFNPATGSTVSASSSTYTFGTTPVLSPNFGAQISIFYNSFDVAPAYYPSTSDIRNFYGMGDLFSDGKLTFGTGGSNVPVQFQGAFEGLAISIDATKSTLRWPANSNNNNVNVMWTAWNNWAGGVTMSTGVPPSFASTTPSPNPTFPGSYSTQCSWAPLGTLTPTSSLPNFNGFTDQVMGLQGCNILGTIAAPLATNIPVAGTNQQAGVFSTGSSSVLTVSQRAIDGTTATPPSTFVPASNLFSYQTTNIPSGRLSTKAGNYDYQAIAWNGPIGRSCYDYRAVRVVAICNRLVAYDVTPGNGGSSWRTLSTEGPMLVASLVSSPSTIVKNSPTGTTTGITQAVNWMTGMFDAVNVTAGFKYLQCGSAVNNALPGGTDPTGMTCGSVSGSRDGEGNYYSLRYSWNVVSAPVNSVFNVATSNDTITNFVFGPTSIINSTTDTSDPERTITTVTYRRTNTWTQPQTKRWVKLLNHGYRNPMTTLRPDVEGQYQLQLVIDDGCSTWQSAVLTVTASCINLATQLNSFSSFVNVRVGNSPVTASTTTPAGLPLNAIAFVPAPIDGSQYVRITMSSSAVAPAGYYYTYMWTVTNVTPNLPVLNQQLQSTNMQGSVASFVPTDLNDNVPAVYDSQWFKVDLTVRTNCMTASGPQWATFTAYIVISCQLPTVSQSNFIFYPPYVSTYSSAPEQFWGFNPATATSTFLNTVSNNYNLYYRQNMVLKTAAQNNIGSMLACDPTGPYCGPNPAGGFMPTILFGGSVSQSNPNSPPGGVAAAAIPDNSAYAIVNGVWGAGWQGLYFSVPVAMTPNVCKIKQTYWVLTGYQNALPFVPSYVPVQQAAAPTCTPTQQWAWTVVSTPCQTCNCNGAANTCSEMDTDVCDFTPNYLYMFQQNNVPTGPGTSNQGPTQPRYNTGYIAPTFNQLGTATTLGGQPLANGASLNAHCVYDAGNRLDAVPNILNLRANCRTSGRGLSVLVLQTAAGVCTATNFPGVVNAGNSIACPMSNIAFVPGFPGAYTLQLSVYDGCGAPQLQQVTVNAQCRLRPAITVLQSAITSYYDCQDPTANNAWGNPSVTGSSVAGKFDPVYMSTLIAASGISAVNDTQQLLPSVRTGACAISQPKTTWNCTDVRNYVNSQNVMVDTGDGTVNKFKACCQCLYGSQTINLFGGSGGTTPAGHTPSPTPGSITPGSTTQHNVLALDEAEYNRNSVILIALVTPMAVLLVGSLAGNVLMALKMRQGAAAGGGYNVRAGDVELSTSPRARVDV